MRTVRLLSIVLGVVVCVAGCSSGRQTSEADQPKASLQTTSTTGTVVASAAGRPAAREPVSPEHGPKQKPASKPTPELTEAILRYLGCKPGDSNVVSLCGMDLKGRGGPPPGVVLLGGTQFEQKHVGPSGAVTVIGQGQGEPKVSFEKGTTVELAGGDAFVWTGEKWTPQKDLAKDRALVERAERSPTGKAVAAKLSLAQKPTTEKGDGHIPARFRGEWTERVEGTGTAQTITVTESRVVWKRTLDGVETAETHEFPQITIAADGSSLVFTTVVVVAVRMYIDTPAVSGEATASLSLDGDTLLAKIGGFRKTLTSDGFFRWRGGTSISREVKEGKLHQYIDFPPETIRFTKLPETYEKVDPAELRIAFEGAFKSLEVNSSGEVVQINGVVKKLAVGNKPIELETDRVAHENKTAFIVTKSYGKLKVTFDSNAQATFWLTPSQRKRLLALAK